MILAFSGIDGSGKSTQIGLLEEALSERGQRVAVIWHRPGYSALLNGIRSATRRLFPASLPSTERPVERQRAFSRPATRRAWILAASLDTLLVYGVLVRWHRLRGRSVILDRWHEDGRLDLLLRFPERAGLIDRCFDVVRRVAPRLDFHFLLQLDQAEAVSRREGKDEPFPDPPHIAEQRFVWYARLEAAPDVTPIDAEAEPRAVHRRVYAALEGAA